MERQTAAESQEGGADQQIVTNYTTQFSRCDGLSQQSAETFNLYPTEPMQKR